METTSVQRIARVLRILIQIALVCNLIILYLVPVAVRMGTPGLLEGVGEYLGSILHPGEDDIVTAAAAASLLSWLWFWVWFFGIWVGWIVYFISHCICKLSH